jgi:DNA-binding winged helix-turn-helix (wHTH) protein
MNDSQDSSSPTATRSKLRFGVFEVDFQQRELRKRGIRVHLQRKPFQILELLLRNPGALVTRAELEKYLWPNLHVNFGRGLNTAINLLRQALGDSLAGARFIETRPGLGYRFTSSVEEVPESEHRNAPGRRYIPTAEADQCYRKGKYLQNKMTEGDLGKSIAHFEAAIAQDRHYGLAHSGLADSYTLFAALGLLPPAQARRRAKEHADNALRVDNELAEAHTSLADIRNLFDWDYRGAEEEYLRAFQLDSSSAEGHRRYALFLSAMGRTDDALKEVRLSQEFDPLSLLAEVESARIQYLNRKFQECADECWQMLVLEPEFAPAQHLLGLAYGQLGLYEEAITEVQNARICSGGHPAMLADLGHLYALAGRTEEAHLVLRELDDLSRARYVSGCWRSIVYLGLGAFDEAFESLEAACRERDVALVWLNVEPRFDPIRQDRRFGSVLENTGLTAYTKQVFLAPSKGRQATA